MEPPESDPRPRLVERLAEWERGEHAPLVSSLLLATRAPSGEGRLEACAAGARAFREVPWPAALEALRRRLETNADGRDAFPMRPGALLEEPFAVLFPLVDGPGDRGPGTQWGQFRLEGVVLVVLDRTYLRDQILPLPWIGACLRWWNMQQ